MAKLLMTPRQTYEQWERGTRRVPGVALVAIRSIRPPDPQTIKGRLRRLMKEQYLTVRELGAHLGISEQAVYIAMHELRHHGWPVAYRAVKRGPPPGRPRGPRGPYVKRAPSPRAPSPRDVDIYRARLAGATLPDLAKQHGISKQRIFQIMKRMAAHAS